MNFERICDITMESYFKITDNDKNIFFEGNKDDPNVKTYIRDDYKVFILDKESIKSKYSLVCSNPVFCKEKPQFSFGKYPLKYRTLFILHCKYFSINEEISKLDGPIILINGKGLIETKYPCVNISIDENLGNKLITPLQIIRYVLGKNLFNVSNVIFVKDVSNLPKHCHLSVPKTLSFYRFDENSLRTIQTTQNWSFYGGNVSELL